MQFSKYHMNQCADVIYILSGFVLFILFIFSFLRGVLCCLTLLLVPMSFFSPGQDCDYLVWGRESRCTCFSCICLFILLYMLLFSFPLAVIGRLRLVIVALPGLL